MAAKITGDMLNELAVESFDPIDWVDENFENMDLAVGLLQRIHMLGVLIPLGPENFFFTGLSIGVQLGRRLAQIEMLNEKVND